MEKQQTAGELMIIKIKKFLKVAKLRNGKKFRVHQIHKNVHGNPVSISGTVDTVDEKRKPIKLPMLWNIEGRSAANPPNPDFDLVEIEEL